jgi:hypothetical protein
MHIKPLAEVFTAAGMQKTYGSCVIERPSQSKWALYPFTESKSACSIGTDQSSTSVMFAVTVHGSVQGFEISVWTPVAVFGTNGSMPGQPTRIEIPPEIEAEMTPAVKAFVVSLIELRAQQLKALTKKCDALAAQVQTLTERSQAFADQVKNSPRKVRSRLRGTLPCRPVPCILTANRNRRKSPGRNGNRADR